jgi:hypothetical protein
MAARMIANEEGRWQKRNQLSFECKLDGEAIAAIREHNSRTMSDSTKASALRLVLYRFSWVNGGSSTMRFKADSRGTHIATLVERLVLVEFKCDDYQKFNSIERSKANRT